MDTNGYRSLSSLIARQEPKLLADWISVQRQAASSKSGQIPDSELRGQSGRLLQVLVPALGSGVAFSPEAPEWTEVSQHLADISKSRATQGFSPSETATFIFSLKKPLLEALRAGSADTSSNEAGWNANALLDALGLYTTEQHQRMRESIIARQQQEMIELSTPVVELWQGILALPLIGTLDSARSQVVMESLLNEVVKTGSMIAIIDITGVPTVDTLVAQHLLKTVAAARLMGADCIISGVRPQIAQTIVHLGIDLSQVVTKASLSDAFALALRRRGMAVTKINDERRQD